MGSVSKARCECETTATAAAMRAVRKKPGASGGQTAEGRIECQEHGYTRVYVTVRRDA